MRISLRILLTFCLLLLTALPVVMFGLWAQQTTLEREFQRVQDSHLLLAKTVTLALAHYAEDLESVFTLLADIGDQQRTRDSILQIAKGRGFTDFQIIDVNGTLILNLDFGADHEGDGDEKISSLADSIGIRSFSQEVKFHSVKLRGEGQPRIFLSLQRADKTVALAAVNLEYFQSLQSSIQFGESGHSAIVDQSGYVMAHPNQHWVTENRNLAQLKPIERMIEGQSGVIEFFSPATKQQMITGYATVPKVGWGVMVPQTLAEVASAATRVMHKLWTVLVVGMLLSAIVAWWLVGWIIKPLQRITDTANRMNEGELSARVLPFVTVPAKEFKMLGVAFDNMAQSLQNTNAKLQVKLSSQQLEEMGQGDNAESKGRVLFVDDSLDAVREVTGWLSKAGYTTFSALNNEESLKIAAVMRPDLAIVNVRSSVDGGFSGRRKLINLLGGVEIPVVAVFPDAVSQSEPENREINAVATLIAPMSESKLVQLIEDIRQTNEWKMLGVKFI